jgi:uncharacterized protein (DUF1800 family)
MTAPELSPWRPTASDPWDARKAAHLLRRAGFGGSPREVARCVDVGLERTLDQLLTTTAAGGQEWGVRVLPNGEPLVVERELDAQRASWLYDIVHGDEPLREKVALFWHDHFSVGTRHGHSAYYMMAHLNLLRRHGLGSLRDLYRALLHDPAMLIWLDNYCNGRVEDGTPRVNLNFGRELFELYSVGIGGGYRQADVVAASQCLSGYGLLAPATSNATAFRPEWHVEGKKRVLGTTIHDTDPRGEALELIEVVLRQQATAQRTVRKLWTWFVSDEAPKELIDELAEQWRADQFELRPLLRRMFESRYFHGPRARWRLVKNPVEFVAGILRGLGRPPLRSWRALGERVVDMGWPLLDYVTPSGLDDGLAWLSAQAVGARLRFLAATLVAPPSATRADASAVVRGLVRDWLDGEAPEVLRAACEEAFASAADAGAEAATAAALRCLLSSPHYQRC